MLGNALSSSVLEAFIDMKHEHRYFLFKVSTLCHIFKETRRAKETFFLLPASHFLPDLMPETCETGIMALRVIFYTFSGEYNTLLQTSSYKLSGQTAPMPPS